jgi:hypothetical protein
MDSARKKELKELYKQMKPDMGIIMVKSKTENKCYIQATQDINSCINSTARKLDVRAHPNKELQKEWLERGADAYSIEVLDRLDYDKDGIKTDYTEDLEMLLEIWKEKLAAQNMEFYKK